MRNRLLSTLKSKFSPRDIRGITLWLKSDSGITMNASRQVATWACSVYPSRTFTQGTDGNKPVWTQNIINGLPALHFTSASSQTMTSTTTIGNIFANNAKTIFAVVRTKTIDTGTNQVIVTDSGGIWTFVIRNTGTTFRTTNYDGTSDTIDVAVAANTNYILEYTHDGVSQNFWNHSTAAAAPVASGNSTVMTGTLVLGSTASAQYLGAYVGEIVAYNVAVKQSDRTAIYTYLAKKWGLVR